MRNGKAILWIIVLLCLAWPGYAQRTVTAKQDTMISSDSTVTAVLSAADSLPRPRMKLNEFKPDPNKAMLYALVPLWGVCMLSPGTIRITVIIPTPILI